MLLKIGGMGSGSTTAIVILVLIVLLAGGYYLVDQGIVDLSGFGLGSDQIEEYKEAVKELGGNVEEFDLGLPGNESNSS